MQSLAILACNFRAAKSILMGDALLSITFIESRLVGALLGRLRAVTRMGMLTSRLILEGLRLARTRFKLNLSRVIE